MTTSERTAAGRRRRPTGVAGLDTVLDGGLVGGSVYIIRGAPGAGKTILSSQICFHQAAAGERCLYLTLLAESHDRLLANLQELTFYDPACADAITYESAYDTLEREGLRGVLQLLLTEGRRYDASLIVLDGFFALQERVGCERELRLFVNQLQSLAHLTGSTLLLLTNSDRGVGSPEFTMVDGWLELGMRQHDYRMFRYLQVHKYRGSDFLAGQHAVILSAAGVEVLPRLESHLGRSRAAVTSRDKLSTGVAGFDTMLGGGVRGGSTTLLIGATGTGKTVLGLEFLGAADADEPALLFGFYETEDELRDKAAVLGLEGVQQALDTGALEVSWQAPTEQLLDELGYRLLAAVRRRGVKRLFVDGIDALQQAAIHPDRVGRFLAALTNVLRAEGVTAMFTLESPELIGGDTGIHFTAISPVGQNIILLRYVEVAARTRRVIAVVKARTSAYDPAIREFTLGEGGVAIGDALSGVEDILTGHGHRGGRS